MLFIFHLKAYSDCTAVALEVTHFATLLQFRKEVKRWVGERAFNEDNEIGTNEQNVVSQD